MVCAIREAHQDPAYFANPSQFNPWRHEQVTINKNRRLRSLDVMFFNLVFDLVGLSQNTIHEIDDDYWA